MDPKLVEQHGAAALAMTQAKIALAQAEALLTKARNDYETAKRNFEKIEASIGAAPKV